MPRVSQSAKPAGQESALGFALSCLRGAMIGIVFSFLAVLIFALFIKLANPVDAVIAPVNQVVKVLSIILGVFFCKRSPVSRGWLRGAVIGVLYILLSVALFSAIEQRVIFDAALLSDVILGVVAGAVSGIIRANIGK